MATLSFFLWVESTRTARDTSEVVKVLGEIEGGTRELDWSVKILTIPLPWGLIRGERQEAISTGFRGRMARCCWILTQGVDGRRIITW